MKPYIYQTRGKILFKKVNKRNLVIILMNEGSTRNNSNEKKTRMLCGKDLLGFKLLSLERVAYKVDFWEPEL